MADRERPDLLRFLSRASASTRWVVGHVSAPAPRSAALGSRRIVVLLLVISGAAWVWRRKCPYLLVGWLWYLGMLVPMIGLVQFASHSEGDRYVYLPQIGLTIALAWGAADLCRSWPYRAWICGTVSALVLASLMGLARCKRLIGQQRNALESCPGLQSRESFRLHWPRRSPCSSRQARRGGETVSEGSGHRTRQPARPRRYGPRLGRPWPV